MVSLKLQAVTKIDPSGIEISNPLGGTERPCNKLINRDVHFHEWNEHDIWLGRIFNIIVVQFQNNAGKNNLELHAF